MQLSQTLSTPSPAPDLRRTTGEDRRHALIEATLDAVAEGGLPAATLRAVAARAGVSNGLIRHYFSGKEALLVAAYEVMVQRLMAPGRAVLADRTLAPAQRLARFVAANLDGEVVSPRMLRLWASFLATTHAEPAMAEVHRRGYLDYRVELEPLVADLLREAGLPQGDRRNLAIQVNALIDGLWLEGALLPCEFAGSELVRLGLEGTGRLLGVKLEGMT